MTGQMQLIRVVAPHFVAGLVMNGDWCVQNAPILAWTRGRYRTWLRAQFEQRSWRATVIDEWMA